MLKLKLFFLLLFSFSASAQKTVEVKTNGEHYFVLKGKRSVKHGPYKIYDHGIYLAAMGMYDNGKRVGRWNFYNAKDSLEQRFNYTTNTVEYYSPKPEEFVFILKDTLNAGDKVRYPVIIGGSTGTWQLHNHFSQALWSEAQRIFSSQDLITIHPAKVNGRAVKSVIIYKPGSTR